MAEPAGRFTPHPDHTQLTTVRQRASYEVFTVPPSRDEGGRWWAVQFRTVEPPEGLADIFRGAPVTRYLVAVAERISPSRWLWTTPDAGAKSVFFLALHKIDAEPDRWYYVREVDDDRQETHSPLSRERGHDWQGVY